MGTPDSIEDPPIPQYPKGLDLPMRDLSLMHHWCISTCYGFGDVFPDEVEPWRDQLPVIAQNFPFLMRGILAVTSLHVARSIYDYNTRSKYIQLAAYHQDLALPEYRAALIDVTEDSVAAVLAFSALTTVYSFAAPKDARALYASGAPEWLFLHRGPGPIPQHWQNWIDKSPLHTQMHRRRLSLIDPTVNPDDRHLIHLRSMLANLDAEEQNHVVDYESAIYWLRQAFAHTCNADSRLGPKYGILFWAERIPAGFLELLSQHKQAAIVLLAHSCVLAKRASNFWYFEGFAEQTLAELQPFLSEEYLPWINWPLQECGLL
ncbi:hypothetical protein K491DRAFT_227123 [Lophiostoma macrostomum CBS 122681]|uniref:Uncharacterized protein n=1 Tax=Lophiostoma macrostomum CBS 122681 TaxID=1314788 RepID=A0A6A6TGB6_9PLEO|nr:hypothetical protein K491DRAFT_227123 [Lophiostoma macrostomum CBS 122681]